MENKLKNMENKLNKIIFSKFVKENFDFSIYEIKLKYIHTFKVAKIAVKLAKKLGLKEDLAFIIGLLHDYARFLQFTEFKTFKDIESFDHGEMACKLLFDENAIENFVIDKDFYPVIYVAIYLHNKKYVDEDFVKTYLEKYPTSLSFKETLNYIHLIRDADKIDILRVITEKDYHLKTPLNGISPTLKDEAINLKTPTSKESKTKLDTIVLFMSFLYCLHFKESQNFIKLNKYLKKVKAKYLKILTPEDQEFFLNHLERIKTFLNNQ